MRRYFLGVTIVAAFNATVVGIGALVLDVPLAGTIAVVTFVTAYIPFIGAVVSGAFAVLLALGTQGTTTALIMLVIVILANGLLQNIVSPIAMGATLRMNPLLILVVTISAGAFFGMTGMVLAAPLTSAAIHVSADLRADALDHPDGGARAGGRGRPIGLTTWDEDFASRYDEWSAAMTEDVAFYVGLAREADGPLVELAVGNGRVAIPVAQATGRPVLGIDSSPAMLEQARANAAAAGVELVLREGDMRELESTSRRRSSTARFARCSTCRPGPTAAVSSSGSPASLRPGGRFAWNAFAFDHQIAARLDGVHQEEPVPHHIEYGVADNRIDILLDDGGRSSLWWATRNEWLGLIDVAGLELEALYGGFAGEPFTDESREYVFVAARCQARKGRYQPDWHDAGASAGHAEHDVVLGRRRSAGRAYRPQAWRSGSRRPARSRPRSRGRRPRAISRRRRRGASRTRRAGSPPAGRFLPSGGSVPPAAPSSHPRTRQHVQVPCRASSQSVCPHRLT